MTAFASFFLLLILSLATTCATMPGASNSTGFNNHTLSLAQLSAQQALCSCDDTPCPEKNTVCMNGACTCIHHEGCRADSDCDQYHVHCPKDQSMMCQQMDPFWRNNVCICVTKPEGGCCAPTIAKDKRVDCKQVLTHCPYVPYATTPYCSLDDDVKFPHGECICQTTLCDCSKVWCPDDGYLQCKEPGKCKCWT
ncbi:hypothetical protein B0H65DRAFT_512733 [Neurospora tetraspora]|uniref:Uncharacterized protein n=1 Tax=Neurospora tetraspora TaxID=94610 RepID=A0AAE0J051_9PEZI|nr:hypothetical protein B0H65DRAFT_512733 [Neurospora tetraspora]